MKRAFIVEHEFTTHECPAKGKALEALKGEAFRAKAAMLQYESLHGKKVVASTAAVVAPVARTDVSTPRSGLVSPRPGG